MKAKNMNLEVRKAMKEKNVYNYEVAQVLDISPISFCRWMQRELDEDKKKLVLDAIESIAE